MVTLPLLYFLSVGPVMRLCELRIVPNAVSRAVYTPLFYSAEACPPLKTCLFWYLHDVWGWSL
jgi:hypothetical protein